MFIKRPLSERSQSDYKAGGILSINLLNNLWHANGRAYLIDEQAHVLGAVADMNQPRLSLGRVRAHSLILARPSAVRGPVLIPPCLTHRPPRPTPLRLQGVPACVLAPHCERNMASAIASIQGMPPS